MLTRAVAAQGAIFFDSDSFRRLFFPSYPLFFRLVLSLIAYYYFWLSSFSLCFWWESVCVMQPIFSILPSHFLYLSFVYRSSFILRWNLRVLHDLWFLDSVWLFTTNICKYHREGGLTRFSHPCLCLFFLYLQKNSVSIPLVIHYFIFLSYFDFFLSFRIHQFFYI